MRKFKTTNLFIFRLLEESLVKEIKKLRAKGIVGMSFEYFDMRIEGE